jgi:hypothetical protein
MLDSTGHLRKSQWLDSLRNRFFWCHSFKTTCCNFLDTTTGGANHLATADQESAEEEVDEGLHDSELIFDKQAWPALYR